VLVIDDTVAIHGDFRRILSDTAPGASELDDLSGALFGGAPLAPSRRYRYSVDMAAQGEAGLALLSNAVRGGDPYDVAFVDMRMPPGWNGVETTARLWEADADLQVVLCTAYSDFRWDEVIAELGTSRHLHLLRKPFSADHARSMAEVLGVKAQRLRG
jgi:CheY-like chemotaxis protein